MTEDEGQDRTVRLSLSETGFGKVVVAGRDLSHLSRKVVVIAEVGRPTEVYLDLHACAIEGVLEDAEVEGDEV